jgi:HEAT repeat protein
VSSLPHLNTCCARVARSWQSARRSGSGSGSGSGEAIPVAAKQCTGICDTFREMAEEAFTQEEIVARLKDPALPPWTREKLVKQLPTVGGRDSLPALADLLSDPEEGVRFAALGEMRKIGGPNAVDVLIKALRHDDQPTAAWAAQRLRQLNYQMAGPAILAVAQERWPSFSDRTQISFLVALNHFHQPEAIPLLKVGIMSGHHIVRHHSANALKRIGTTESREVIDWALSELPRSQRHAVRKGIRRHGSWQRLRQRFARRILDR